MINIYLYVQLFSILVFSVTNSIANCDAKYGGIDSVLPELQAFANTHIMRSFEYLLMSTHFENYEKNREGFGKVFRKLSDSTWEDGINLMKYIGKRGGNHSFIQHNVDPLHKEEDNANYELNELQSLAKAVDIQKQLAADAFKIHEGVTRRHKNTHDPEIAQYIEEEFAEKHSDEIRKLVGHVSDLTKFLNNGGDSSLAMYLFDEYLQKSA